MCIYQFTCSCGASSIGTTTRTLSNESQHTSLADQQKVSARLFEAPLQLNQLIQNIEKTIIKPSLVTTVSTVICHALSAEAPLKLSQSTQRDRICAYISHLSRHFTYHGLLIISRINQVNTLWPPTRLTRPIKQLRIKQTDRSDQSNYYSPPSHPSYPHPPPLLHISFDDVYDQLFHTLCLCLIYVRARREISKRILRSDVCSEFKCGNISIRLDQI